MVFAGVAPCDPAGLQNYTKSFLAELKAKPYQAGCTFSPQVFFVYGSGFGTSSQKQYCTHVLRQESLDDDFNALMKEFGSDIALPDKHLMGTDAYNGCTIDREKITQPTKDMIYQYYRDDFETFGYEYPK